MCFRHRFQLLTALSSTHNTQLSALDTNFNLLCPVLLMQHRKYLYRLYTCKEVALPDDAMLVFPTDSTCSFRSAYSVISHTLEHYKTDDEIYFTSKKMTAANVPFPFFFVPCPGEPAVPFKTWIKIFQNYLVVINATEDAWLVARRRAVLLHCLGTEGQRIF